MLDPLIKELVVDITVVAGAVGSAALLWNKALKPVFQCAKTYGVVLQDIEFIAKELKPNGGASLRDSVNRIAEKVEVQAGIQTALYEDSPSAIFRCDTKGSNISVNRTYCRLLGAARVDLLGFGWRNYIEPVDRESYDSEWADAFSHIRSLDTEVEFHLKSTETQVLTRVRTYPIKGATGLIAGFIGVIDVIPPTETPVSI